MHIELLPFKVVQSRISHFLQFMQHPKSKQICVKLKTNHIELNGRELGSYQRGEWLIVLTLGDAQARRKSMAQKLLAQRKQGLSNSGICVNINFVPAMDLRHASQVVSSDQLRERCYVAVCYFSIKHYSYTVNVYILITTAIKYLLRQ